MAKLIFIDSHDPKNKLSYKENHQIKILKRCLITSGILNVLFIITGILLHNHIFKL